MRGWNWQAQTPVKICKKIGAAQVMHDCSTGAVDNIIELVWNIALVLSNPCILYLCLFLQFGSLTTKLCKRTGVTQARQRRGTGLAFPWHWMLETLKPPIYPIFYCKYFTFSFFWTILMYMIHSAVPRRFYGDGFKVSSRQGARKQQLLRPSTPQLPFLHNLVQKICKVRDFELGKKISCNALFSD